MGVSEILTQIDHEIASLQQARALLAGSKTVPTTKKAVAVPAAAKVVKGTKKKKRNLTPEGRARIAEAVKRRWAQQKKATSN